MPEIRKNAFEIKHHAKFVFLGTFDELRFKLIAALGKFGRLHPFKLARHFDMAQKLISNDRSCRYTWQTVQ